jgi:uroporphyrin-III C-methyltransferase
MIRSTGFVWLVGAGPGDPDLITVKGARAIATADALVYDRLIHPDVLASNPGAARYDVGKRDGSSTSPTQDAINDLLIDLGRKGLRVARVKGGDPFVFGRGGEEALALRAANIPFEVVPGVPAGTAVPASADIPVTHRGVSASVTFVTANSDPARTNPPVDWKAIARLRGTIVIFMGARTLGSVVETLLREGMDPHLPVAAIQWGTYGPSRQRELTTELHNLPVAMAAQGFDAPVTIVLGQVVRLQAAIRGSAHPADRPDETRRSSAVLLIDHGSRVPESNAMLHQVASLAQRESWIVEPAHMELASPTIAEGFAACVQRGATEVVAVPYMLSPGRHSTRDVPRLVAEAAAPYPDVRYRVAAPLGVDERLASLIIDRASAVTRAAD